MGVTMSRMVENITGKVNPTIRYPEERRSYSDRYRGAHILTAREDGSPRCVACYMCATACPADCIYIEPAEHPDPLIEKYPARFEIDMLRCVFFGFCVEACPEEAIIMSRQSEISSYTREETLWGIDRLMKRPELAEFGLGFRPNDKLVDSTLAFVPKERVTKQLAGRVTLKEKATMIQHVTFEPEQQKD
jgi:NADH-quinone oxidoreductase subunit I